MSERQPPEDDERDRAAEEDAADRDEFPVLPSPRIIEGLDEGAMWLKDIEVPHKHLIAYHRADVVILATYERGRGLALYVARDHYRNWLLSELRKLVDEGPGK